MVKGGLSCNLATAMDDYWIAGLKATEVKWSWASGERFCFQLGYHFL